MDAKTFVRKLAEIRLDGVFNPYADHCDVHDAAEAADIRRSNLESYLRSVRRLECDTIWMGRDLGYRGGRRTGLALTDEQNLNALQHNYPGSKVAKATLGPIVAERTAAEIWKVISSLSAPPLLWNVFPFHPHEPGQPFTNRKFSSKELNAVDTLNSALLEWIGIKRIISIGQDAAQYAERFGVEVSTVRHPSYGGVAEFREGIDRLYGIRRNSLVSKQSHLF